MMCHDYIHVCTLKGGKSCEFETSYIDIVVSQTVLSEMMGG